MRCDFVILGICCTADFYHILLVQPHACHYTIVIVVNFVCLKLDPCYNYRCENGGRCLAIGDRPYCECPGAYTGYRCETKLGTVFHKLYSQTLTIFHVKVTVCYVLRCVVIYRKWCNASVSASKCESYLPKLHCVGVNWRQNWFHVVVMIDVSFKL